MFLRATFLLELLFLLTPQLVFDDPSGESKKPQRAAEVVATKSTIKAGITADVGPNSTSFRSDSAPAADSVDKPGITADLGQGLPASPTDPVPTPSIDLNRGRYTILYPNSSVKADTAVTWTVTWPTDTKLFSAAKKHLFTQEFLPAKKSDKLSPFPGWGWKEGDLRENLFSPKTDLSDSLFVAVRADEKGQPLDSATELKLIVTAAVPDVPDPAAPGRIKFKSLGTIIVRIPAVTPGPNVPNIDPVVPNGPSSDIAKAIQAAVSIDTAAGQNVALAATADFPAENSDARLSRVYGSAATLVERTDPASNPPKTVGDLLSAMNRMSDKAQLPEKPQLSATREAIAKSLALIGFTEVSKSLTSQDRANAAKLFRDISKALKPN